MHRLAPLLVVFIALLTSLPEQEIYIDPATGIEFVKVPHGSFVMGSPPSEADREADESQHEATIPGDLWFGRTEVTQQQWTTVMGANPSNFNQCGPRCPVESVTWFDVQEFLDKLNRLSPGNAYRLPGEAEWEYACRAGTTTAFAFGDALAKSQGRFDVLDGPVAAATYAPNAWGIYDMHGNVWEWTSDWFDDAHTKRVIRGGSWYYGADSARCALRYTHAPEDRGFSLGFRIVRDAGTDQEARRAGTEPTTRIDQRAGDSGRFSIGIAGIVSAGVKPNTRE